MDAKPRAKPAPGLPTTREIGFAPDEVVLADGSALKPRPWRPARQRTRFPSTAALAHTLRTLRTLRKRGRQPQRLEARMHTTHAVGQRFSDEAGLFRSHFENGLWHWTYHDVRGRLLARGPERAERWAAHRALLAAIAEYCTGCDEEEPPFEVDEAEPGSLEP